MKAAQIPDNNTFRHRVDYASIIDRTTCRCKENILNILLHVHTFMTSSDEIKVINLQCLLNRELARGSSVGQKYM